MANCPPALEQYHAKLTNVSASTHQALLGKPQEIAGDGRCFYHSMNFGINCKLMMDENMCLRKSHPAFKETTVKNVSATDAKRMRSMLIAHYQSISRSEHDRLKIKGREGYPFEHNFDTAARLYGVSFQVYTATSLLGPYGDRAANLVIVMRSYHSHFDVEQVYQRHGCPAVDFDAAVPPRSPSPPAVIVSSPPPPAEKTLTQELGDMLDAATPPQKRDITGMPVLDVEDTPPAAKRTKTAHSATPEPRSATGLNSTRQTQHTKEDLAKSVRETRKRRLEEEQTPADSVDDVPAWNPHERIDQDQAAIWQALKATGTTDPSLDWAKVPKTRPFSPVRDMAKHSERVTRQHHKALAAADVEHGNDHQQIPSLEGKWFAALRILSLFVDPEAPPPLSGNVEFIAKVAHSIFADSLRIHECGVYRHSGLSCVHQDVFSTDMVDEASRVLSLTCKMFRVLSMKKAALTIQVAFDTLYRYGEKRRNARFFPIGVWGKGKGYEAEKGWAHIYFDRLTEYAAYFHDDVDVKNRLMPRILMRYCSTPKPEPDRHNSYFACDGAVFHCQPRRQAGQPGLHSLKDPEQIRHADVYMSLAPSLHAGFKNHSEKYYRDRKYDFLSMVFSGERTSPYAFTTWRASSSSRCSSTQARSSKTPPRTSSATSHAPHRPAARDSSEDRFRDRGHQDRRRRGQCLGKGLRRPKRQGLHQQHVAQRRYLHFRQEKRQRERLASFKIRRHHQQAVRRRRAPPMHRGSRKVKGFPQRLTTADRPNVSFMKAMNKEAKTLVTLTTRVAPPHLHRCCGTTLPPSVSNDPAVGNAARRFMTYHPWGGLPVDGGVAPSKSPPRRHFERPFGRGGVRTPISKAGCW